MNIFKSILVFIIYCHSTIIFAQENNDTKSVITQNTDTITPLPNKPIMATNNDDTIAKKVLTKQKKHNPKIATRRSAILPGWGQAYNKQYWKIPVVYGVLAIPTVTFFYNNTWYNRTKSAYDILFKASQPNASQEDIDKLKNIHPKLQGFSLSSLQTFRNSFRKDRDYSVLWFAVAWGLNVVDATVFAHLKEFDVSDNLSVQINPTINPINKSKGFSLVFNFKKNTPRIVNVR
ncbi:MAG: hypothetical protein KF781_09880 [Chitinophagaceae bacterium]|nr:hypothetical protein [Chitinophagaceae bacterium]MCW5904562.1 hypothetical protein [Chitinophagaceae bacterium]